MPIWRRLIVIGGPVAAVAYVRLVRPWQLTNASKRKSLLKEQSRALPVKAS